MLLSPKMIKKLSYSTLAMLLCVSIYGCSNNNPSTTVSTQQAPQKTEVSSDNIDSNLTIYQKNALKSAKNYASLLNLSKKGLYKQLEFEGFESDDIQYAIDNIDVDYNETALASAKSYTSTVNLSKKGLHKQLVFDGFEESEARYAVDNLKFDFNQSALKAAKNYATLLNMSKDGIYNQLIFDGFEESEARYAVDNLK